LFFLQFKLNKWFHIFSVFFRLFLWFRRLCTTLFVLISRLCAVGFWFPVLLRCLFDSGWKISFEKVHIWSMTLTASTFQIRRHEYSKDLNIVIFVCICTLPFYAISTVVVSLFTNSSFFLANLDLYCIDVLYQFEWMNIVYFCQKKKNQNIFNLNLRSDVVLSYRNMI